MWSLESLQKHGGAQTQQAFRAYIESPLKKNIPGSRCWKDSLGEILTSLSSQPASSATKEGTKKLVALLARIARDSACGKSPSCGIGSQGLPPTLRLKVDTREKKLAAILGPLPFVEVTTLELGDIALCDERDADRQVLIERKRDDDALQNMKKLEQQRSRLVQWVGENKEKRRALFVHETPSWATEAFAQKGPLPVFCQFQKGPAYTQRRQTLTPAELGLSLQSSTLLTYNLPWVSSAHTWHTSAIVLDLYRCWAKDRPPKSAALAASLEKCAQVRASSTQSSPTLQFYMLCLGPLKGSAVFDRWKSLRQLTSELQESPRTTQTALAELRYGPEKRRVGPKNARNLLQTLGFPSSEPSAKKRKLE